MKNIHPIDQFIRLALGLALVEFGYFWVGGVGQWAAYVAGAILVLTATFRFCPVYRLLGISLVDNEHKATGRFWSGLGAVTLIALVVGGSYASAFFSRKVFLEEFNAMNHFYKQTLFVTGKNERANAIANYEKWASAFEEFKAKYTRYQPHALKSDHQFATDLASVAMMMSRAEPLVRTGDLHQAHLDLEKVRPVFQALFKRNGFSMLSVALVDFHDAMEGLLDAAHAKDSVKMASLYAVVNDKLTAVETEANDAEIQTIRKNLEALMALSKAGPLEQLPAQAEALKSSFVKVYLKRG